MLISAHQPAFLPWLGYFEKVYRSDVFVILDGVQFEKNSFINRNRILTDAGVKWMTVPVAMKGHIQTAIKDIKINTQMNWKRKHTEIIRHVYGKSPNFDSVWPIIERNYGRNTTFLVDIIYPLFFDILELIGIQKEIKFQTEMGISTSKQQLIIDITQELGGKGFLFGANGMDYVDTTVFESCGIKATFQEYRCEEYRQISDTFVPGLSIIDLLFNEDPDLWISKICNPEHTKK